jgi:acyl carrier protein
MAHGVPADVVIEFRRVLEDELGVDLSRLSAEDDFNRNLSSFWEFDSMADVELIIRLEEEFRIKIKDNEAQQATTIAEMVNLVWNKLRQREA